jgi:hypothetical protein
MDYRRVVNRNYLQGDYVHNDVRLHPTPEEATRGMVAGDLRRLEKDQRDGLHLKCYAEVAGVSIEQVKKVLDALFGGDVRQLVGYKYG